MHQRINILCWRGYEDRAFVECFENRYGCSVQGENFESDLHAAEKITNESHWDLININNPYVSNKLYPAGSITALDPERYRGESDRLLPQFRPFFECSWSNDRQSMLGVCQRFGPFNLVINTRLINPDTVRAEGFNIADDPALKNKFGVLDYPEFNIMHSAISCGVNPFGTMTLLEQTRVSEKLRYWYENAFIVTKDHSKLNNALINEDISLYISGGIYTAASARLAGHRCVQAVTPSSGPINGHGGIAFVEVTALSAQSRNPELAQNFLHYILEPEQCHQIAFADGIHNPIAQMGDPKVFTRFSLKELDALQWDTLEEDMSRCTPYAMIPSFHTITTFEHT